MSLTIEKCVFCKTYQDELVDGVCIGCEEELNRVEVDPTHEEFEFYQRREEDELMSLEDDVNPLHSDWEPEDDWDDSHDPYAHLFYGDE